MWLISQLAMRARGDASKSQRPTSLVELFWWCLRLLLAFTWSLVQQSTNLLIKCHSRRHSQTRAFGPVSFLILLVESRSRLGCAREQVVVPRGRTSIRPALEVAMKTHTTPRKYKTEMKICLY